MKLLYRSIMSMIFLTVLLGIIYPLTLVSVGYLFAKDKTTGSMIEVQGHVLGSSLIGQRMPDGYFQSRPSANDYNPLLSGGTSFAVNNLHQRSLIAQRVQGLKTKFGNKNIPEDLVFSSGSGLDPDISLSGAMYQAHYIANYHHIPIQAVTTLIKENTNKQLFNIDTVNVLKLNILLSNYLTDKN
jgi:potassium-transporting ATPase KdpC subunit